MKLVKEINNLKVEEVILKLQDILDSMDLKIFSIFNHSKEAENVWLNMRDTQVVVFWSPKIWTLLMQNIPEIAIDLPLKILIYKNEKNQTIIAYESIKDILKKYKNYDKNTVNEIISKIDLVQKNIFKKLL